MQIGETKTAIEVSAPVVMLDTQSATQSVSLTSTMITELPMDVREPWGLGADKQGISSHLSHSEPRSGSFRQGIVTGKAC